MDTLDQSTDIVGKIASDDVSAPCQNDNVRATSARVLTVAAPTTFGQAAKLLTDMGFDRRNLLPIAAPGSQVYRKKEGGAYGALSPEKLGKIPSRYIPATGEWCGLQAWTEGLSDKDWDEAQSWPTDGIGHLADGFPALDCDLNDDSPHHAARLQRLCHKAVTARFGLKGYGIRGRKGSQRRLYMFRAGTPGSIASVPDALRVWFEGDTKPHTIEILGRGKQFVVKGQHPRGGRYVWRPGKPGEYGKPDDPGNEVSAVLGDDAVKVGTSELDAVLDDLEKLARDDGAVRVERGNAKSGGGGTGELHDYSNDDPILPVEVITEGLKHIPANNEQNHPHRNDCVSVLAMIRAAYGRHAEEHEAEAREWATAEDWADDEYFQHIWSDHGHRGVKVDQWALEAHFRKAGYHEGARYAFPSDEVSEAVAGLNEKFLADTKNKRLRLLHEVSELFHYRDVNTTTRDTETPKIRHRDNVLIENNAYSWWRQLSTLPDNWIVDELHKAYGKGEENWGIQAAFWRFQRELIELHPECFFAGLIKHPIKPLGAMIPREDEREKIVYDLNVIAIPKVQKLGEKLPSGAWKKGDAWLDVEKLLNLQRHIYGPHFEFELNSQAYMAQREKRVGHWVFLVGDGGCGKSITQTLNSRLFNGRRSHFVQGNVLVKAEGARFAFVPMEGARSFEIREIPPRMHADAKELFESVIKQAVDAGLSGDVIKVEPKSVTSYDIPNYARIFGTSNYPNAVDMAENDRRTFFVTSGITLANREELIGDLGAFDELEAIIADPVRLAPYWRMLLDRDIPASYQPKAAPPITFGKAEAGLTKLQKPFARHASVAVVMFWKAGREMFDAKELWYWMEIIAANERDQSNGEIDHTALYKQEIKAEHQKVAVTGLDGKYRLLRENMKEDGGDRKPIPTIYAHVDATLIWDELAPAPKPEDGGKRAPSNASKARVLQALADDRDQHPIDQMQHLLEPYRPRSKPKLGNDFKG